MPKQTTVDVSEQARKYVAQYHAWAKSKGQPARWDYLQDWDESHNRGRLYDLYGDDEAYVLGKQAIYRRCFEMYVGGLSHNGPRKPTRMSPPDSPSAKEAIERAVQARKRGLRTVDGYSGSKAIEDMSSNELRDSKLSRLKDIKGRIEALYTDYDMSWEQIEAWLTSSLNDLKREHAGGRKSLPAAVQDAAERLATA